MSSSICGICSSSSSIPRCAVLGFALRCFELLSCAVLYYALVFVAVHALPRLPSLHLDVLLLALLGAHSLSWAAAANARASAHTLLLCITTIDYYPRLLTAIYPGGADGKGHLRCSLVVGRGRAVALH